MALTMRPTGLGHGAYEGSVDFNVFSDDWLIGRIYERKGFADDVRFFWSLHGVVLTEHPTFAPMVTPNRWKRRKLSSTGTASLAGVVEREQAG